MTVQRYELADCGSPYVPWREMQKADDGEWVEFEDYERDVGEPRALLRTALRLTEDIATDEAGEWAERAREALVEVER